MDNDPIKELVENYKAHIRETKLSDEVYKWELLTRFGGHPNVDADDFGEEIKSINYGNLLFHTPARVIRFIAENRPEPYREAFKELFDENIALDIRMVRFQEETLRIYREVEDNFPTHHDERTIGVILTFHDPDKYTLYKASFYRPSCELFDVAPRPAGERYIHYLKLVDDLITRYLFPDSELLSMVDSFVPENGFRDPNRKILAQDILYQMLEKSTGSGYWVFQSTPKIYDLEQGLRSGEGIDTWRVSAHREKIKAGDKVILWATGARAGCYGLAEVIEEPHELEDGSYSSGIEVTDNLVGTPILQDRIRATPGLEKLKAGTQGTNFSATKKEYEIIRKLIEIPEAETGRPKYWLYAPGEGASRWDEFYNDGIVALGWDELGDLNQYDSQQEIAERLRGIENTESSKMNDSRANFEFLKVMKPGDVVIPKRGRTTYLGYGIVESDYIFNGARPDFNSSRRINWKRKGEWDADFKISLKTLTDITKYPEYVDELKELIGIELEQPKQPKPKIMNDSLNTILYGPPGTGKTYNSIDWAVAIADGKKSADHEANKKRFDELRREDQIEFVTFHQNYSYEDFVVGIRPDVESDHLRFQPQKGIFYRIARRARDNYEASLTGSSSKRSFDEVFTELVEDPIARGETVTIPMASGLNLTITELSETSIHFDKPIGPSKHTLSISTLQDVVDQTREAPRGLSPYYKPLANLIREKRKINSPAEPRKKFVLIIDEINRANISRVFGELITLLEDDKRLGEENELRVTLPNGEKDFGVPPNLYLIGTMNTADKSIALIDIALRRRFEFVGFYPIYDGYNPEAASLLEHINKEIFERKKSADYLIGHAYFMKGEPIEKVLRGRVIPLLMEYFSSNLKIVRDIFSGSGWTAQYDEQAWVWRVNKGSDDATV